MTAGVVGTLTIRNLDDHVKKALRERAAARGVSMEQEARDVLSMSVERLPARRDKTAILEELRRLGAKPIGPFDQKAITDDLWSYVEAK